MLTLSEESAGVPGAARFFPPGRSARSTIPNWFGFTPFFATSVPRPATNRSNRCLILQIGELIMTNEIQNILQPPATGLNVLVAYDEIASGIQARALCDRLAQPFKPSRPWTLSFWSLSALGFPLLARQAADEAARADLLIVAVHGETILPPPIKSWISRSVRRVRSHAGALVAQFHGILRMNYELSPAYECLKHIADDSAVEFFSEVVEPAVVQPDDSIESVYQHASLRPAVPGAWLQLKMKFPTQATP